MTAVPSLSSPEPRPTLGGRVLRWLHREGRILRMARPPKATSAAPDEPDRPKSPRRGKRRKAAPENPPAPNGRPPPPPDPKDDLTAQLNRMADGDAAAAALVFARLYDELRRIAHGVRRKQGPNATLAATELIGMAYTRLLRRPKAGWKARGHFLATAARAMWQVLVDYQRRKGNLKDGKGHRRVSNANLDQLVAAFEKQTGDILKFDDVLQELRAKYPRSAQLVELRFFGDFTMDEVAELLDMSLRSAEREWEFTKAWLKVRLG
jgi:RNA polymerase sigma factor (TIGR02999 family)